MRKAVFFFIIISLTAFVSAKNFTSKSLKKADGFSWKSESSNNFTYYFESDSPAERDIEIIKTVMENGRSRAEALLGASSQLVIELFLVDSRKRMKEMTEGFEANAWANGTVQASVYNHNIKAIGAHETLHCLAGSLWGGTDAWWISEGLAVYSDDRWYDLALHLVAKWLFDHQKLLPISALVDNKNWKNLDMVTYPQSGSFVKFIYEKYGISSTKKFWQKGIDGGTKSIGKNLLQLEEEWLSELAKFDATSIHYQAP